MTPTPEQLAARVEDAVRDALRQPRLTHADVAHAAYVRALEAAQQLRDHYQQ